MEAQTYPIDSWTCDELQKWIVSIKLGNTNETKIIASICEQLINGEDFNSMESISDIMDSFPEISKTSANKIYTSLQTIRQSTCDNQLNEDLEDNEEKILLTICDGEPWQDRHISTWTCDELQQWILDIKLGHKNQNIAIDVIKTQSLNGNDFNSMQNVSDIMDAFPALNRMSANKIFAQLSVYKPDISNNSIKNEKIMLNAIIEDQKQQINQQLQNIESLTEKNQQLQQKNKILIQTTDNQKQKIDKQSENIKTLLTQVDELKQKIKDLKSKSKADLEISLPPMPSIPPAVPTSYSALESDIMAVTHASPPPPIPPQPPILSQPHHKRNKHHKRAKAMLKSKTVPIADEFNAWEITPFSFSPMSQNPKYKAKSRKNSKGISAATHKSKGKELYSKYRNRNKNKNNHSINVMEF